MGQGWPLVSIARGRSTNLVASALRSCGSRRRCCHADHHNRGWPGRSVVERLMGRHETRGRDAGPSRDGLQPAAGVDLGASVRGKFRRSYLSTSRNARHSAPRPTIGELAWLSACLALLPWLHFKYLTLAVIL